MEHFGAELAADRCGQRKNVVTNETHDTNSHKASKESLDGEGNVAGFLSGHERRMSAGKFDGDIGSGVSGADDEHFARSKLRRVAIVIGMQLLDGRMKIFRERRRARLLVVGHGDDNVFRLELFVAGGDEEAIAMFGDAIDAQAGADRQVESSGI